MAAAAPKAAAPKAAAPKAASWGIVGYREFVDYKYASTVLDRMVVAEGRPRRVVSGGALGADALAKRWATEREIEYLEHPPARHCARELLARNTLIVRDSDVIVAFLSKKSRGTLDTIRKARHAKRRVVVIDIDAVANEAAASPPE